MEKKSLLDEIVCMYMAEKNTSEWTCGYENELRLAREFATTEKYTNF